MESARLLLGDQDSQLERFGQRDRPELARKPFGHDEVPAHDGCASLRRHHHECASSILGLR
jgi:hypothetical protein